MTRQRFHGQPALGLFAPRLGSSETLQRPAPLTDAARPHVVR
ncbi:MAG: hypothetical protein AB7N76_05350 [Planctomycetota bacterium]